jgi:CelD/BcsL family acetyltransferase involved in cellulose biosynthesis
VPARLIDIQSLGEDELVAWRALAARALEPNPFFEPEFLLPAHRHLEAAGVSLLVAGSDDDWSACMPVATGRLRRVIPAIGTWRHLYSFLGTPLVAGSDPAPLEELVRTALMQRSLATLEWFTADGPVASVLDRAVSDAGPARVGAMAFDRAALHRDGGGGLLERMPRRRRHELQRQRRRLAEELEAPLECVDRAGEPSAVERFLELESRSWKGREGTAMLTRSSHAEFFRGVCEGFATMGRLQLFELHGAGRTVAMKCNLVAAPGLFTFKIAHDEELGRFSPGVQLEVDNAERFLETDLDWMDSCAAPDNQTFNRLWPDRRPLTTLVLARPGLRARLTRWAFRAAVVRRTAQGKAGTAEKSTRDA